jgi:hypothetical protein
VVNQALCLGLGAGGGAGGAQVVGKPQHGFGDQRSIESSSALVQRLSLMVECASASKTPKRSVSISSSRIGEAGTPAWLVSIMREPPCARGKLRHRAGRRTRPPAVRFSLLASVDLAMFRALHYPLHPKGAGMVAASLSETQLKDVLKAALIEVLEERSDLLRDVLAEVMEDVALGRAIQEGETSGEVSRDEVLRALEAGA